MFVFACLALLASGAGEGKPPEDVQANFESMLKQLGSMHQFIEGEEVLKKKLQDEKVQSAVELAAEKRKTESVQKDLDVVRTKFSKVESSWVKTAYETKELKSELATSKKHEAEMEKENKSLRGKLLEMVQEWRNFRETMSQKVDTFSLDIVKLNVTQEIPEASKPTAPVAKDAAPVEVAVPVTVEAPAVVAEPATVVAEPATVETPADPVVIPGDEDIAKDFASLTKQVAVPNLRGSTEARPASTAAPSAPSLGPPLDLGGPSELTAPSDDSALLGDTLGDEKILHMAQAAGLLEGQ